MQSSCSYKGHGIYKMSYTLHITIYNDDKNCVIRDNVDRIIKHNIDIKQTKIYYNTNYVLTH